MTTSPENNSTIQKYILFNVGEEEFGLPVEMVLSIEKVSPVTKLPNTTSNMRGIYTFRENVIPVIDLGIIFKKQPLTDKDESRFIVVSVHDKVVAFVADGVHDVRDISFENVQKVLVSNGSEVDVIKLENNRLVILPVIKSLLDLDKMDIDFRSLKNQV